MSASSNGNLGTLFQSHLQAVRERHDRSLAATGYDHVVIASGTSRIIFLDDMPYPFKVNAPFKVWVPVVDNPNCYVVYTPGKKPRLLFWQPVDYWHKTAEPPSGFWVEGFDITPIANASDAKRHFPSGKVAFIGDDDANAAGEVNPQRLLDRLHWERTWKTDYEIECMRIANVRGAKGHLAAEKAFRAGASEYEIHLAYLKASDHTDEELPYGNIIARNENAAVLHYYHHGREQLEETRRHSFLIDAGASFNGYASDITRTYSQQRDEFQELIDEMEAMQLSLVDAVAPGVDYIAIHMKAHRGVGEILLRHGFVRDVDADGAVSKRLTSTFFPHGVGHFIGLQVHDVAGFMADPSGKTIPKPDGHPYLRLTRKIEPRMVFTIEPGLYFIDSLLGELKGSEQAKHVNWEKVEAFRKFGGIRIEDDVAVTADGRENLTRDAFASLH